MVPPGMMGSMTTETVIVVGQGYGGLPLAMRAVAAGYDVVGYDVDEHRSKALAAGTSFVEDISDTEVAAAYVSRKLEEGQSLGEALESGLEDLDGFYTFVVGTHNGFGVVRDPIACKPAVMAETDQYVAFGSEYRALVNLPGIEDARVWEPEPATVYFWER